MKLSLNEIKRITLGAVNVYEKDGAVCFDRMTKAQADAFTKERENNGIKTKSTAGIRLDFYTDSEYVKIKLTNVCAASSRSYFGFDIWVDGVFTLHQFSEDFNTHPEYAYLPFVTKGRHRVQVYLPNMLSADVEYVELSDGAYAEPYCPKYDIICYGDSITQGYDAFCPSRSYVNIVARELGAQVFNKAIGGAKFNADVIEAQKADIVTAAYGTNDWRVRNRADFCKYSEQFLEKLKAVHGDAKIFIILPIWRANHNEPTESGDFFECRAIIGKTAEKYGFTVLDGIDLVPHDTRLFYDGAVHPNDTGFDLYGKSVAEFIKNNL